MSENGEVGLFIDFENVRYGLKNNFGREPDPQYLMAKARKYGPVSVAWAYADFTEHPDYFRRKLEVAGITPRDVARRSPDVAHKSSSDMAMLMDIIDCLLDRPTVNTLMLMTGDSDFIRVVARARNRFGKRVIISGVPGSVSFDLISSADGTDPISEPDWLTVAQQESSAMARISHSDDLVNMEMQEEHDDLHPVPADPSLSTPSQNSESTELSDTERRLIKLIEYLDRTRPYLTFLFVKTHALSPNQTLNLTPMQVDLVLTKFKERGILRDEIKEQDGRTLRFLYFIREHPMVQQVLNESSSI